MTRLTSPAWASTCDSESASHLRPVLCSSSTVSVFGRGLLIRAIERPEVACHMPEQRLADLADTKSRLPHAPRRVLYHHAKRSLVSVVLTEYRDGFSLGWLGSLCKDSSTSYAPANETKPFHPARSSLSGLVHLEWNPCRPGFTDSIILINGKRCTTSMEKLPL